MASNISQAKARLSALSRHRNPNVPMLSGGSPATWHDWVHGIAFLLIIATCGRGFDIAYVEFNETTITEEVAKLIREQRLKPMQEVLEAQGFTVSKPGHDDQRA